MITNNKEETAPNTETSQCWAINVEWYKQNNRSFMNMLRERLCSKCQKRVKEGATETNLLAAIGDCCSKAEGFITGQLPILESAFRIFLANGNQPLDLEELGQQLSEHRGGDRQRTSAKVLARLLSNDRCYGLRPVSSAV
ncbi:MAG: hypothetical protein PHU08_06425 [Dehalococcoidales bacterium]|nr:hypothetical protein [Dehalococcoidales bacterium]